MKIRQSDLLLIEVIGIVAGDCVYAGFAPAETYIPIGRDVFSGTIAIGYRGLVDEYALILDTTLISADPFSESFSWLQR